MTEQHDLTLPLQQQVECALKNKQVLSIFAGNSKKFKGFSVLGEDCCTAEHKGIIHYEPTELVITARSGTTLVELEKTLADNNQMLGFEPPHFSVNATLGGTVSSGLAGPRRASAGAVRDFVLGTRLINGLGQSVRFGGEVMKNVAGYDVSRLMVGAMGTLGILLDISLKILPRPEVEQTLVLSCSFRQALAKLQTLARYPLPISASCCDGEFLYLRLSGSFAGIDAAIKKIGGEKMEGNTLWSDLKEHQHTFFMEKENLWRCIVPPATPLFSEPKNTLIEWQGALRWVKSKNPRIQKQVIAIGGDAELFYQPSVPQLSDSLLDLHQRVKQAMDPSGIFNIGRLLGEVG
jgi:glycolate oxidase FAD binding subunit